MKTIKRQSLQKFENLGPSLRIAAAVAAALVLSRSGQAAVIDWSSDAGSSAWASGANWIGGAAPANSLNADIARFNQTSYANQPNAGATGINGIQVGDGTTASAPLTISGTSLSIGAAGLAMFANVGVATISSPITLGLPQTWINDSDNLLSFTGNIFNGGNFLTVNGSGDAFISSVISGLGGIDKVGTGTLILTGANAYTGLTTVNSGILQIGDNDNVLSVGAGNYQVAGGAQLVFARNATPNGLAFVNQSITGAGDVVFTDQSTGYFTFRGNYFGTLGYTGHTIVNYDAPVAETTWFQRALWLEKDNLLPHATVLDLVSGKVFLRANTGVGETVSGLTGDAGTFITTDQNEFQKFTVNIPDGATHTYDGVIGIDASSIPIEGINAGNITFTKKGAGTQILTGANTYAGGTIVNDGTLIIQGILSDFGTIAANGGTLALDYSTQTVSKFTDSSLVTMGGGTLSIIPNGSADTAQSLGGVTLAPGGSEVTVDRNEASQNATLNLRAIVREPGATLNVTYGGTGSGTAVALTDNTNTNGILGGWAVFNGSDWAINSTNASGGPITGLAPASYTADAWAPGNHTSVTMSSAPASDSTTDTLRFNAPSINTVTLAGTNTVGMGGILVTANVGDNASGITGGSLQPGAGGELIVHQQNADNLLTIASTIVDNGLASTGLTKAGPGVLILSDANTYSGSTTLSGGTIVAGRIGSSFEPSSLGASFGGSDSLILNGGGTLQYTAGTVETDRGFTVNGAGGIVDVVTPGTQLSFLGPVVGAGDLVKSGPGMLVLGDANTYTGNTVVNAGVLQVGNNDGSTTLNPGDFSVADGSRLIFSRNVDNVAFLTQSINGAGDVVFQGQPFGYFTFRGNYTGSLSYTGRTIVNYDAEAGGTWFERTLWLEKDDLLPHATILELQSGKVYLRANVSNGETISGLIGGPETRIATDQAAMQKVTIDVPAGLTYIFDGEIGFDPALPESTANIALTKAGPGTQVLSGANSFAGGLRINAGTIRIGASTSSATAVGSGLVSIGTNTTNGTLDLNGQTELVNSLVIGAGAAPNGQIIGNSSMAGDATLISSGTSTFGGIIQDSVGGGTRKTGVNVGGGALTLTNANTYTGNTNVMVGSLVLGPGGSLAGTGVTIASGAVFAPNPGASSVTAGGSISLENGSVLDMVDGAIGVFNVTGAGTSFLVGSEAGMGATLNFELSDAGADRITISNAAAVTGTNTIGISVLGSSLTPSSTYTLLSAAGGLSGDFQFSNGAQQTSVLVGATSYQLLLANTGTSEMVTVMSGVLSTWAGAGSTTNTLAWSTGSNWSDGLVPGGIRTTNNSDSVVFNSNPAISSPAVDAGRNIQNIIFDTENVGAINLAGSAFVLTANGSIQSTSTVTANQTVAAAMALHGNARFLSGSASGATLTISGQITAEAPAILTLGGSNAGSNAISGLIGDGASSLGITKSDAGTWNLTNAANDFTGPVRINGGTLAVPTIDFGLAPSSLGASASDAENLVIDGGTLQYNGGSALTDRSITIESLGAMIELANANATLNTLGSAIGTGGLTKTGPGSLILGAVNTYAGDTVVADGILQFGDNTASTTIESGNISVAAGAEFVLSRNIDNVAFTTQSISGDGDVRFIGQSFGYFTWRGNYTGALTYTGKTTVSYDADAGGTWFERGFWLEKDDLLPHTTVLDVLSGKVFLRANTTNGETISGLMGNADTWITTDRADVQKLTLDVPAGEIYAYNGVIGIDSSLTPIDGVNAGNIALIKSGGGKQILAGANTYSSTTTIDGGTLVVSGSITGASTTVGDGAVLASGEAGTIQTMLGGSVAISSGGILAPGDFGAVGTMILDLDFGGKLDFATGATLNFDLGATSDRIRFTVADDWLNGSGNPTLALNGTINYAATYPIFENVTTPGFTLAEITGYDTANYEAIFAQVGSDYQLSFAVPEPATTGTLMAGLGLMLGIPRFRRRVRTRARP